MTDIEGLWNHDSVSLVMTLQHCLVTDNLCVHRQECISPYVIAIAARARSFDFFFFNSTSTVEGQFVPVAGG
jgi:hypothetical protein